MLINGTTRTTIFGKEMKAVQWMTRIFTLIIVAFVVGNWFHRDSTIYASGYSWGKFSSIQNGMTPEEVTGILGHPLSREPINGEVKRYGEPPIAYTIPRQTMYWYSKLRNVKGEHVILIHFNEAGRVYQID